MQEIQSKTYTMREATMRIITKMNIFIEIKWSLRFCWPVAVVQERGTRFQNCSTLAVSINRKLYALDYVEITLLVMLIANAMASHWPSTTSQWPTMAPLWSPTDLPWPHINLSWTTMIFFIFGPFFPPSKYHSWRCPLLLPNVLVMSI